MLAQALLKLFLSNRDDVEVVFRQRCFFRGEERQRVARIVNDQVLEVLVVTDGVRHARGPGICSISESGKCRLTRHRQSLKIS